jgi:serralysin
MKGDDSLFGGQGADTLTGGAGADSLSGGDGADVFRFTKLSDSTAASSDLITDLTDADQIDLHLLDADTGTGGDQAFHLVGAFGGHAGELTVAYDSGADLTTVSGDVDGDGVADLVITIAGDSSGFTNFVL